MGWTGSAGAAERRRLPAGLGGVVFGKLVGEIGPKEAEGITVHGGMKNDQRITAAGAGAIARLARRLALGTTSEFPAGPIASGRSGDRILR